MKERERHTHKYFILTKDLFFKRKFPLDACVRFLTCPSFSCMKCFSWRLFLRRYFCSFFYASYRMIFEVFLYSSLFTSLVMLFFHFRSFTPSQGRNLTSSSQSVTLSFLSCSLLPKLMRQTIVWKKKPFCSNVMQLKEITGCVFFEKKESFFCALISSEGRLFFCQYFVYFDSSLLLLLPSVTTTSSRFCHSHLVLLLLLDSLERKIAPASVSVVGKK